MQFDVREQEPSPGPDAASKGGFFMSEINILVVDDEKEIAELVEIYLVSDGYRYLRRRTPERAWRFWKKKISIWCCWTL